MKTIQRDIVGCLLISKDDKYLVGLRSAGGVYPLTWHILGGGVNTQETKEQAVIREIREEAGMDISRVPLKLIDDTGRGQSEKTLRDTGEHVFVTMHFFVYEARLPQNANDIQVTINDEFSEYGWFTLDQLKKIPLAPPTIVLFRKLGYIS